LGSEPTGGNEDEPHQMSPDNSSSGASRAPAGKGEGRRLPAGQPSAQGVSGGVSVDSMSGSGRREGWEICGREATQPSDQAGVTGKAEAAAAEGGTCWSTRSSWWPATAVRPEWMAKPSAPFRRHRRPSESGSTDCNRSKDGTRRVLPKRQGTPQGGVISPLLASLYLNPLDWAVNERCGSRPVLVRYAAVAVAGQSRLDTAPNGLKRCDQTDPERRMR
jgi:hypothetical protein